MTNADVPDRNVRDTISRQEAIDTVDEALTRVFVEHRDIAEKMINKMPSAQQWIPCVEVVRCNQCKHYEGVHDVPGCAPCAFWGIGAVMWDDFCERGERWDG